MRVFGTGLSPLVTACLFATGSSAASIIGDTFSVDFSCLGCANNGPMEHVAELPGPGFEAFDGTTYSVQQDEVSVQWIDDDTFAFVVDFNSDAEDDIELVLGGLDFVEGSTPHVITGITTNTALTDCPDEFEGCSEVTGPFTSFTDRSITVSYSQSTGLRADGPVWAFDVSTVPEPSTLVLLASGLLALGARRGVPSQRP